jgi:predicted Zn-dependent peptidase
MNITQLSNGIRIVSEFLPSYQMVNMQFRYGVGSGTESKLERGAAHFLEHLTLSGLNEVGNKSFMFQMADYGAIVNALTSMEHTTFYIEAPWENIVPVLSLFSKLLIQRKIIPERIEIERQVILNEIESVQEDFHASGLEQFYQIMLGEYGHPILGTTEDVENLNPIILQQFQNKYYTPDNLIIGVAGNVSHEEVVRVIEKELGELRGKCVPKSQPSIKKGSSKIHVPIDSDMVQLFWGLPAPGRLAKERNTYALLTKVLCGDGTDMWSRLFYRTRTQLGLSYTIGGEYLFWGDLGMYVIYAETGSNQMEGLVSIVEDELQNIKNGISDEELSRGIASLSSSLRSSSDSLEDRVERLIDQVYYGRNLPSFEEEIHLLTKIKKEDVLQVSQEYLRASRISLVTLGGFPS